MLSCSSSSFTCLIHISSLGSAESLAESQAGGKEKVFKSAFAKELEKQTVPSSREVEDRKKREKEEMKRKEEDMRKKVEKRRLVSEEGREAQREYSKLREENASLRLEIMKIQLEDKKYRDLQQEVDQLGLQLRKVK